MSQMRITVLGVGHIGSTVGRLWHAAGHEITFAARHATGPRALAEQLGERAHAAPSPRGWRRRRSFLWPCVAQPSSMH